MSEESNLTKFIEGDVFVGATVLNNPDDDHAGDGRVIQFDENLNQKGILWTRDTTHLVGGLKFDQNKYSGLLTVKIILLSELTIMGINSQKVILVNVHIRM